MNAVIFRLRWATPFYAALMALALIAFWPGYLAAPSQETNGWVHFHVVSATLWVIVLIAQPWAILNGRRRLHVFLGRTSYGLFPLVILGFVGLAHSSMQGRSPQEQAIDAYYFYIRVVLVAILAAAYLMGVVNRKDPAVHSRYMVCTGLPLIDPVLHRISQRVMGGADLDYQLLTFGIPCALLIILILAERRASAGRHVFPAMLSAFVVGYLPLGLKFYTWGSTWTMWKSLARQFAALPLS